jgi:small subunit ribosomal protein S20
MANTKSAKKQALQNQKRRSINLARKTALKTAIKKVRTAVADQKSSPAEVMVLLRQAEAKLARAKGKGTIHKRTASRKVSRLAQFVANQKKA